MKTTNQQLYKWHIELQQMQHSVIGHLLGARIRDFYKHNKIRLDTLFDKMKKLQEFYFVMENNVTKEFKDEKGEIKPVMLEGKTFEQFQEALKAIMDIEIQVII